MLKERENRFPKLKPGQYRERFSNVSETGGDTSFVIIQVNGHLKREKLSSTSVKTYDILLRVPNTKTGTCF